MSYKEAERDHAAVKRIGFIFGSIYILGALCGLMGYFDNLSTATILTPKVWLPVAIIYALVICSLVGKKLERAEVLSFITIGLTITFSILLFASYEYDWLITNSLIFSVAISLIMVTVFRVRLSWHFGLCVAIGIVLGFETYSFTRGFLGALGVAIALSLINLTVKLFLDHEKEANLIASLGNSEKIKSLWKTLRLMIPVFALVVAGLYLHHSIQFQLVQIPYSSALQNSDGEPLISEACSAGVSPEDRNSKTLQDALLCAADKERAKAHEQMDSLITELLSGVTDIVTGTPEQVAGAIARLRPNQVSHGTACSGFTYSKKFVRLSFRSPCRTLVNQINAAIAGTYNRLSVSVNSEVSSIADRGNAATENNSQSVKDIARTQTDASFDALESSIKSSFIIWKVIEFLSFTILIISLFAAFQMVLGRVLFDISRREPGRQSLKFQLLEGDCQPVSNDKLDSVPLEVGAAGEADQISELTWYVNLRLSRRGDGTALRICIPQPGACILNRIFTGTYLQTRVVAKKGGQSSISIAGDKKLVRVTIKKGQSLCFQMGDLIAFSGNVKLQTRYNTHVGTQVLGLGRLYCTASGENGVIVLKSEGSSVTAMTKEMSSPPSNLLVWDECQEFSFEQNLDLAGIWLNPPSIVSRSNKGTAILDEGTTDRFPILARCWDLTRFLFLPI